MFGFGTKWYNVGVASVNVRRRPGGSLWFEPFAISITFQEDVKTWSKRRIKFPEGYEDARECVENMYEIQRWLAGGPIPTQVELVPLKRT